MTTLRKNLFLMMLIFLVIGCQKEETNSNLQLYQYEIDPSWSDTEKKFFSLNKSTELRTRNGSSNYHPLILDAHKFLANSNASRPFVNSWVSKLGMPNWEKSLIYYNNAQNRSGRDYRIAIPFSRPNQREVYAIVTLSKRGNAPYRVSILTKKQILLSRDCRFKSHIDEVLKMEHAMYNIEDVNLKNKKCDCADQDVNQLPPDPPTNSTDPCDQWVAIKFCIDTETGFEWWGEKLPIMKDHDQDGIINNEDQDWLELAKKYNITEQQFAEVIENEWENYLEDLNLNADDYPFQDFFDSYYDDNFYSDNDPIIDLFDGFIDSWHIVFDDGGIWDQLIEDITDKDHDGILNRADHDDSPADGYDDRDCYYPPLHDPKAEDRTIECEWFWVRLCDLEKGGDYLNQLVTYLDPCPECDPNTTQSYEQRLADFCAKYNLSQEDCEWLRDNGTQCPVYAPVGVTEACFKNKLRLHSIDFLTILLSEYQDYTEEQNYNQEAFIQQHGLQLFLDMGNGYLDAKNEGYDIPWIEFVEAANIWGNNTIPPVEEIQNGIEIIMTQLGSFDPPSEAYYRGGTSPRGNTEDLEHGFDGGGASGDIRLENLTQQELWDEMNDLMTDFSIGSLETVALNLVEFFDDNASVENIYANNTLSQKVIESNEMRNFVKKFGARLNTRFKQFGFQYNGTVEIPQNDRPVFNTKYHKANGLTICVNDTEETRVYTYNLMANEETKEWELTLYCKIDDHFGLDRNDVRTYQWINEGFAAWWRLQWVHDQVPFHTNMNVVYRIKGVAK